MSRSADQALECFASLQQATAKHSREAERGWEQVMARIKAEWEIIGSVTRAGDGALSNPRTTDDGNR
jgi:hypothetical protein